MKTLLFTGWLLWLTGITWAQAADAVALQFDSLPQMGTLLDKGWKWHAGDDPDWAKAGFDDSKWEVIDPSQSIDDLPQLNTERVLWLRLRFALSGRDTGDYALMVEQSGASQLFLNGKKIKEFGIVSGNKANVKAFDPLGKPFLLRLDSVPVQTLAVRYVFQPGMNYRSLFSTQYLLFKAKIAPFNAAADQYSTYRLVVLESFRVGIFLMLFIVHIILYLFYPTSKTNAWYSLFALIYAVGTAFLVAQDDAHLIEDRNFNSVVTVICFNIASILLVYAVYCLLRQKSMLIFVCIILLNIVALFNELFGIPLIRDYLSLVLQLLLPLLMIVLALKGLQQKINGAAYIFMGSVSYFILWILFFLSLIFNVNRIVQDVVFHLAVFVFPVSISAVLGLEFRFINRSLTQKLEEVKTLSNEKQQILTTQNETLEQQVAERTADLNHKNRELEIEAALERVRSRAMAMQKSEELQQAAVLLFQQVQALGIPAWSCGYNIWEKEEKVCTGWMSSEGVVQPPFRIPLTESPTFIRFYESRQKGESFYVEKVKGEALEAHYRYMSSLPDFREIVDAHLKAGFSLPTFQIHHVVNFTHGNLIFITGRPVPEAWDTFKRFATVFDQTYTRFLDLQKAEVQAREAKIETALERVRSRTMAMQHSEEVREVVVTIYEELQNTGFNYGSCVIIIIDDESGDMEHWVAGFDQKKYPESYHVPYFEHPYYQPQLSNWKSGDRFFTMELSGELKKSYDEVMFTKTGYKNFPAEGKKLMTQLESVVFSFAYIKHGALMWGPGPLSEEYANILQRFAKVFEQTYTRFLDLKQAEAQTHKAQIETALERVRARALAMQQPEELIEVAQVLRLEMGLLGVEELEGSTIFIPTENTDQAECWFAIKDTRQTGKRMVADRIPLRLNDTWVGRQILPFFNSEEKQISIPMTGPHCREWMEYCYALSPVLDGFYGDHIPDRTYHLYKFSNGAIGAASPGTIPDESWELLQRAAAVFSLAYSRFRDLTQARFDLQRLKEEKKRSEDALTELQATQNQLIQKEKMASLGELTAGIAHEIQNPLNFVNNFSEVSQELVEELKEEWNKGEGTPGPVDELLADLEQNLTKIHHHGQRADSIVKGMLQHSRATTGEKQPTDLNALAEEYLRLSYHGLRAKDKDFNARLVTDFDSALGLVEVVPQEIGRVLLNLFNNAFYSVAEKKKQAGDNYQPTVSVRSRNIGGAEIRVSDNGLGVPKQIVEKIFQPFFTTKPTGQGTGLGLSLSYDIITKGHGGTLQVETREGEFAEFVVTLPIIN